MLCPVHKLLCNFQDISVTQHFWINNIKRSIYIHDENLFIYWLLSHFIWHQSNLICKLLENILSPVCRLLNLSQPEVNAA
jgi:hypothetical protein